MFHFLSILKAVVHRSKDISYRRLMLARQNKSLEMRNLVLEMQLLSD